MPVLDANLLDETDAFATLRAEWESLHARATHVSIFSSWPWQRLWWEHYAGRRRSLRLAVTRDAAGVRGILPLYVETQRCFGVGVRVCRLLGTGGDTFPDDLGPLLEPGLEIEASEALAGAVLDHRGWDVLDLADADPRSPFLEILRGSARARRLRMREGVSERILFTALPATWDEFLKSLGGDLRHRVRRRRRKLDESHPWRFFVWEDGATLDQAVDRLIELHHRRWQPTGRRHGFSSPEYRAFHRAAMNAAFERGWLRLYCLEIEGNIVAMSYDYAFRKTVFLMQAGFDPSYGSFQPGLVLLERAIEHAIGEGASVFDYLRGDERYKHELATGARETRFLTVYGRSAAAFAHRLRRVHLPALKARVERAAPPV